MSALIPVMPDVMPKFSRSRWGQMLLFAWVTVSCGSTLTAEVFELERNRVGIQHKCNPAAEVKESYVSSMTATCPHQRRKSFHHKVRLRGGSDESLPGSLADLAQTNLYTSPLPTPSHASPNRRSKSPNRPSTSPNRRDEAQAPAETAGNESDSESHPSSRYPPRSRRPPLRVLARHLHVEKQHLLREPKDLPHLRVPASRHLHTDIRRLHLPHENQRRLRLGLQQPLGLAARHHAALPPRFPKHPGSFNQTRRRAPRQEAFISPKVTSRRMKSTSTWKITPNFRGRYATMWRRRQQSG